MDLKKTVVILGIFTIFFILFLYFFHPITNLVGDLAFYLKTGEIIVVTHTIPKTNLFSYTNPQFPFINPNWLSEVVFYLIQSAFGFGGLIVMSTILSVAAFSLVFVFALKKHDVFTTLCLGLLSLQVLYERTDIKPELFSYVLLSLFLVILYTYREKFTKWIFLLIPLMLLWINLHIYFFVGVSIVILFAMDRLITQRQNILSQKNKILFLVTIGICLVTFFNPEGIKGALYPLFVSQNYAFPVEENISFFTAVSSYQDTTFLFFGVMVILLFLSFLISFKKLKLIDFLLGIFFTIVGFAAVRTFPLFIYGIFLPLIGAISSLREKLLKKLGQEKLFWIEVTFFSLLVLILVPTILFNIQNNNGIGIGVKDDAKSAILFIHQNNIHGPIYNNFDIGDYLEYSFYPKEKVFVDARAEAYPKTFFENVYFPSQTSSKAFDYITKQYNFQTAIIAHSDTSDGNIHLIQILATNPNWTMVYINSSVVIFVRNIPSNSLLIKTFHVTENTIHLTKDDTKTKQQVRQLANVFRIIGWDAQWLQMSQRYLEFDPTNCGALENVAFILQKERSPKTQQAINIYIAHCVPQSSL